MHTIIRPLSPVSHTRLSKAASLHKFRQPNYDCHDHPGLVRLTVYVPGVEAAGVDVEACGTDLLIIARKTHFVRVNWQAAHLESAQRDYQLRLRLGHGFNYGAMQAEIHFGVLTVTVPKCALAAAADPVLQVA